MKKYDSTKIKNIAIAGQAGSGKTSLTEALLYKSGATDRLGKITDGNTVSDYTPDEIKRKCSVYTSLSSLETGEFKVNLLDTPGMFDYEGEAVEGIAASGCVLITVSGKSGVRVGTHKAYDLAKEMGKTVEELKIKARGLHELNPMMGHRGCRLAVTYPEIAVMQTKAVIKAAIAVQKRHPEWHLVPEIMIPLVGEVKELAYCKKTVVETADAVIKEAGVDLKYEVGTMIEIPRAALTADEIAKEAEFFCFGTNDLTQMTFGFSRDDAGKFLPSYYAAKIYESDPFARLDTVGVGKLMKMAVELGHKTRKDIHCGICGEHGGDPSSIEFCHEIGLNYVSCSPYRVPIARLAAAQANIRNPRATK